MLTILTIGHSNHPLCRFLDLLTQHGVGVLADIRRYPRLTPASTLQSRSALCRPRGGGGKTLVS